MSAPPVLTPPRSLRENLEYRRFIREWALKSKANRDWLIERCREDFIFFLETFCIEKGTLVVTDRGPIPIENVTSKDLVWDGENWVSQRGPVFQGVKDVIDAYGISLTPDHKVMTNVGWKESHEGHDRAEVRTPNGFGYGREILKQSGNMELSVLLWQGSPCIWVEPKTGIPSILRVQEREETCSWLHREVDLHHLATNEVSLQQPSKSELSELRRQRDINLRSVDEIREFPGRHGGEAVTRYDDRQDRQQRELLPGELPLGNKERTGCEQKTKKAEVYDLINCGPRRAFTVVDKNGRPLLVHNCWIYEPRPEKDRPEVIPFLPWYHQIPVAHTIIEHLGYRDIGLEKARGEGASWICLMIILWRWLFYDMQAFGLVSRNELAADNPEDPDSLGWKIDWQLKQLPLWMAGKKGTDYTRNISKHTWINTRNGSTITAYPATGDLASGGRKTAFFMDELAKFPRGPDEEAMAATEPVTNCRLLVSTPAGAEGAYYRCMTEPSSMVKIVLDWTKNPTRNKNLFRVNLNLRMLIGPDGYAVSNDIQKWFFSPEILGTLTRRGFDLTDKTKLWSPWYVDRCLRPRMTPKKIAQEYDRDYGGSSSRFFPSGVIEQLIERARQPVLTGEVVVDYDQQQIKGFTKMKDGRCKLWIGLAGKNPPPGNYIVSCDVCTGHGGSMSSASTIVVTNKDNGCKVFEYANPVIKPEQLAIMAVAVCRWFLNHNRGTAYLIWEANGPGGAFRDTVFNDTNFRNLYYRKPHKSPNAKDTKEPGWWSGKEQKRDLLSKYRFALMEGTYDNPSEYALRECLCYVEDTGGKIKFVGEHNDEVDPANDGENHGDRVIADALGNFAMEFLNGGAGLKKSETSSNTVGPPPGSFAARRKAWAMSNGRSKDDW